MVGLRSSFSPRFRATLLLAFAWLGLAWSTIAQSPSTASVTIGGPGAIGCQGTSDPPTLDNGVPAGGTIDYAYDPLTQVLTVTVNNTSPIVPGVPNPVITRVFLNVPPLAVTNAVLIGQMAASGPAPNFTLAYDPQPASGESELPAGCLGRFGIRLANSNGNGIAGGIANPLAEILPGPLWAMVRGPVVFQIQITTTSPDLTASTFASAVSLNPAGGQHANAAFKFQGGGSTNSGGFIGNGGTAGSPAAYAIGIPDSGQVVTFVQSGTPTWHGCTIFSTDPGPTVINGISYPLGLDYMVLLEGTIPPAGAITRDLLIPNLPPSLLAVNVTFYGIAVLADQMMTTVSVSEQFTLTIRLS